MKPIRTLLVALAAVACLCAPAAAQTTLNSTTLSSALTGGTGVNNPSRTVALASVTNIAVNDILVVDREAMQVNVVNTSSVDVTRGVRGSVARAHAASAIVWSGVQSRFYQDHVVGPCTATAQGFLPHIVLSSSAEGADATVYQCTGSYWQKIGTGDVGTVSVNCRALLIADMVDQSCFIADRPYVVTKITEVHAVKEAGGTLTLIPRKQTGTVAPASGTALATALDRAAAATVQTVRTATLSTTATDLFLSAGDRLALDFTDDVAGELADVTVTFTLVPR